MRLMIIITAVVLGQLTVACSDTAGTLPDTDPPSGDAGADADVFSGARELEVPVPATGRVYVNLARSAVVAPAGDPKISTDWDLAFEGFNVLTNSGPSGSGHGGAFGPLDMSTFVSAAAPSVPFVAPDKAGGAFLDWYAYDDAAHVLYSRFHVYGVKDGTRLWKVQVLTYYGEKSGAPVSALYSIRYAEITSGVATTQTVQIDGTAGGVSSPANAPSGCLDLATGSISMLTIAAAQASSAWDLCFRRDAISVNGEVGGPRGVGALDLEASQTSGETLAQVKAKSADSEKALFDGVNAASFASASFRGDHVVSAFESGGWLDASSSPPSPVRAAWFVADAGGTHKFLVAFTAFHNATTSSPGTVVMQIKPVNG